MCIKRLCWAENVYGIHDNIQDAEKLFDSELDCMGGGVGSGARKE